MDKILEKELKRITLLSKYNTNNTLHENFKRLINESGSSIYGFIDNVIKSLIRKSTPEAGEAAGEYLSIGGKRYRIHQPAGLGNRTPELMDGNNAVRNVNIGGETFDSADLINIARGDYDKLIDTDFSKKLFRSMLTQAETDDVIKRQLDQLAESGFGTYLNDIGVAPSKLIDDLRKVYKGSNIDDVIKTYLKNYGVFSDDEIEFLMKHYFPNKKIRITARAGYDVAKQNLLTFFGLRKLSRELIRASSIIKQTFVKNIEETFQTKVKEMFEQFYLDIDGLCDDILNQQIEKQSRIKKFREFYTSLVDENAFKTAWGESWQAANDRAIKEIEAIYRQVLQEQGMPTAEIDEFIKNIRSNDINKMLDETAKYVDEASDPTTATSLLGGAKNTFKEFINYKVYNNSILNRIITKETFPDLNKILNKALNNIKSVLMNNFKSGLMFAHFDIFRLPGALLRSFTRYGPGGFKLFLGSVQTAGELLMYKFLFGGLVKTGGLAAIIAIEDFSGWLSETLKVQSLAINITDEKRKLGEFFRDQYTQWFTKEYLIDNRELIPIGWRQKVFDYEWNTFFGIAKILGVIGDLDASENPEEEAEKTINLWEQKNRESVEKLILENPKKERQYVSAFEKDYWRVTETLKKNNLNYSDVVRENGYTNSDVEVLTKHLKLGICPDFEIKGDNVSDIEKQGQDKIDKFKLSFGEKITKNDNLCAGLFLNNKFYSVTQNGFKQYFIDDDGKQKPLKEFLLKINQKLEKEEEIQPKPAITPTQEKPNIDQQKPIDANRLKVEPKKTVTPTQNKQTVTPMQTSGAEIDINESTMIDLIKKLILEEEEEKTLKMKDWDEIFTFQKIDDKNPGKYTDVKIKMDSVMDRMPHWRKKYNKICDELENCDDDGEDDSFVRAVIDTHPEVVRILFTKGLAHLTSSEEQEDLNEGLHGLLAIIREAKSVEVEVWSVYRHPSSPDKIWSLVKGDFKPKELSSMDVKMQKSPGNTEEKKKDSLSELKKKESDAIELLSKDEKKGLLELPIKVRNKIKEKISKGWTTEEPPKELKKFYKEDNVNTIFVEDIIIYKLKPNESFFNFIQDKDLTDNIKRGFCRAIYYVEKEFDLPKEKMKKINDILDECEEKLDGKYGQNYL
jgi:hypothetical protein